MIDVCNRVKAPVPPTCDRNDRNDVSVDLTPQSHLSSRGPQQQPRDVTFDIINRSQRQLSPNTVLQRTADPATDRPSGAEMAVNGHDPR